MQLLEPQLRRHAEQRGCERFVGICAEAAAAQPPLQALLALRTDQFGLVSDAAMRCSSRERWIVFSIALGYAGFTLEQRWTACLAVVKAWWRASKVLECRYRLGVYSTT